MDGWMRGKMDLGLAPGHGELQPLGFASFPWTQPQWRLWNPTMSLAPVLSRAPGKQQTLVPSPISPSRCFAVITPS